MHQILADLVAEQQALDQFLQTVKDRDWKTKTPAAGWDVRDQVSHLAFFEGTTLFDRVGRVVCEAACLPRRELYEAWETARRTTLRLNSFKRFRFSQRLCQSSGDSH